MSKPNGILAMNPEKYREIDGVVFDLDSYARHCKPPEQRKSAKIRRKQTKTLPKHRLLRLRPCSRSTPIPTAGTRPRTAVRRCRSWAARCRRARAKATSSVRKTA